MVSDTEEVYNGIVWHLICCPFTPFLTLFGEILSKGIDKDKGGDVEEALEAMEELPGFLKRMALHNALAAKLERIAVVLMQHAKSVAHPQGTFTGSFPCDAKDSRSSSEPLVTDVPVVPSVSDDMMLDPWVSGAGVLDWGSFFDNATKAPLDVDSNDNYDAQEGDLSAWMDDLLGGAAVDWLGQSGQV